MGAPNEAIATRGQSPRVFGAVRLRLTAPYADSFT